MTNKQTKTGHDKLRSMLQKSNKNKPQSNETNEPSEMFKQLKIDDENAKENQFIAKIQKAFPETLEADCRAMYRGYLYMLYKRTLAESQALIDLLEQESKAKQKLDDHRQDMIEKDHA